MQKDYDVTTRREKMPHILWNDATVPRASSAVFK